MLLKTKIGIVALVIGAFVAGGFALNAFQADAFGWGKWFNKDSEEWQAKMGERKAEMEEWKAMSPEERQAKMEEFKANRPERPENGEWEGRGLRSGHLFGFRGMKGFADEVNYGVVNLDNGVQITITSDNPDIVKKLQDFADRINNISE